MSGRPSRRRDLWTAQCPRARSTVIALIGSRLWQPDVGLGCSLSCQEPRDKPPVSCTSRSDGATDRPAVGTRRLFGGNSTPTGACLCRRLRALKRPAGPALLQPDKVTTRS